MSAMKTGIVVLAHGSRDPVWRENVDAIAQQLRAESEDSPVACAYLELCAPSLDVTAQDMVSQGVTRLRVLPLFFGIGKHASEDIPERLNALRQTHPQLSIDLLEAAGNDLGVRQALVNMVFKPRNGS